jgi:hypothetical protein
LTEPQGVSKIANVGAQVRQCANIERQQSGMARSTSKEEFNAHTRAKDRKLAD